jgi:hypothetical protein
MKKQILLVSTIAIFLASLAVYAVTDHRDTVMKISTKGTGSNRPHLGWQLYRNSVFGYSISYPATFSISASLDGFYDVGDITDVTAQPSIEIESPQSSIPLSIQIVRNPEGYSPNQWLNASFKQDANNVITAESCFSIQGRDACSIEFKGTYSLIAYSAEDRATTLDTFFSFTFIRDADRMIIVSFPTSTGTDCEDCELYSNIFSTLSFEK